MTKRSGFTLLEAALVLIIIAVLAAILFPVFAPLHESNGHSSCMSNLKQVSLGVVQYTQDYDETFPNSGFAAVPTTNAAPATLPLQAEKPAGVWREEIWPYTKNAMMYYCPSDQSKQWRNNSVPAQPDEYAASYTMNRWTAFGLKREAIKKSAEFILLAERNNETQKPNGSYLFAPWDWSRDVAAKEMARDLALTRHQSGSIVGFSDGHTKWHNAEQMVKLWNDGAFHP